MAVFPLCVPVSGNEQNLNPGVDTSDWNPAIISTVNYTWAFPASACQNICCQKSKCDTFLTRRRYSTSKKNLTLACCPARPQERSRVVPVRSSSEYGRRPAPALYQTGRQHSRVACIKAEFFMKNGIIWNVAEGYGSVAPIWCITAWDESVCAHLESIEY